MTAQLPTPFAAGLQAALELVPRAVLVTGPGGCLLWANAAARQLLAAGDALRLESDRVRGLNSRDSLELAKAIEQAAGGEASAEPPRSRALCLSRGADRLPLQVLVVPWAQSPGDPATSAAGATLVVHDPDVRMRADPSLLEQLYGMTPSQARLAALLAQGFGLGDAAALLGSTEHTVRSHLKRVFAKTGTKRQAELVHVLLSGPGVLRLAGESRDDVEGDS
jgi:DNA-binding CsgD family transcriptional regulator